MAQVETKTPSKSDAPAVTRRWPSLLLIKLGRITMHRFTTALAPLGLTPRQFAALVELRDRGPLTQQWLAEELHLDPTNVVAILNELEREGLAVRRRDPDDRRRHIVEVTGKGSTRVTKAEAAMNEAEHELLGALDADEREVLDKLLYAVWDDSGGIEAYARAAAAEEEKSSNP